MVFKKKTKVQRKEFLKKPIKTLIKEEVLRYADTSHNLITNILLESLILAQDERWRRA